MAIKKMKTDLGTLGESKVISHLIEAGYDVFTSFSGKSPFDLLVIKDDKIKRVEVKSTSRLNKTGTSWDVGLRRSRPNGKKCITHLFDNTRSDILAIYIHPEDRVCLKETSEVTQRNSIAIPKMRV